MRNKRKFGWITDLLIAGLAIALFDSAAFAGESKGRSSRAEQAGGATTPPERARIEARRARAEAWDDSHMQSRFPSTKSAAAPKSRLILPEGTATETVADGRTIYSTPDRNWKSGDGHAKTGRRQRSSASTGSPGGSGIARGSTIRGSSSIRSQALSQRRR